MDEIMTGKIVTRQVFFEKKEIFAVDWILFTSRNGVASFMENIFDSGLDVRAVAGAKIAAIGASTAECLKTYGICADVIPEKSDSVSFAGMLKNMVKETDIVWYPKAGETNGQIKKELEDHCVFREITVYDNLAADCKSLTKEKLLAYDAVFFTCGSSANRLLGEYSAEFLSVLGERVQCISIGPQCSRVLHELGIRDVKQAEESNYVSMAELFASAVK